LCFSFFWLLSCLGRRGPPTLQGICSDNCFSLGFVSFVFSHRRRRTRTATCGRLSYKSQILRQLRSPLPIPSLSTHAYTYIRRTRRNTTAPLTTHESAYEKVKHSKEKKMRSKHQSTVIHEDKVKAAKHTHCTPIPVQSTCLFFFLFGCTWNRKRTKKHRKTNLSTSSAKREKNTRGKHAARNGAFHLPSKVRRRNIS
jgi:hypothetical protein